MGSAGDHAQRVDLNADAGESFGRWTLGRDSELLPHVTSVSVACGFHAGDPVTMRRSIRLARDHGVALGAHPGLPDLIGFGRREIAVPVSDAVDYCLYQLGALRELAADEGVAVEHVKPHGALYRMCSRDPELLVAIARAIVRVDSSLILIALAGPAAEAAASTGIRVAREAFVDVDYDEDGAVIVEPRYRPIDPGVAADRAAAVLRGRIRTRSGRELPVEADTICVHGDGERAVEVAAAVSRRIAAEGVTVMPLRGVVQPPADGRPTGGPGVDNHGKRVHPTSERIS